MQNVWMSKSAKDYFTKVTWPTEGRVEREEVVYRDPLHLKSLKTTFF